MAVGIQHSFNCTNGKHLGWGALCSGDIAVSKTDNPFSHGANCLGRGWGARNDQQVKYIACYRNVEIQSMLGALRGIGYVCEMEMEKVFMDSPTLKVTLEHWSEEVGDANI